MLVELSVVEQKYQAVLAVIADGRTVSEVAHSWGVSRQRVHDWLVRYEQAGLEGFSIALPLNHDAGTIEGVEVSSGFLHGDGAGVMRAHPSNPRPHPAVRMAHRQVLLAAISYWGVPLTIDLVPIRNYVELIVRRFEDHASPSNVRTASAVGQATPS
jgi:hypothetical protein